MKILAFSLLLALAPLYDAAVTTRLGGQWLLRRDTSSDPVRLTTNPSDPVCHAEMSPDDSVHVAHTIFKARVLPGTIWSHVTDHGHTVMASSSVDGLQVRVLAADGDPLTLAHAACAVILSQSSADREAEKLENAILAAGES